MRGESLLPIACTAVVACAQSSLGPALAAWAPGASARLAHESSSGLDSAQRILITDGATWQTTWDRIYATVAAAPPVPEVDFSNRTVLLAALGTRPSGGFDVRIDSVVSGAGNRLVYVTQTSPGPTCAVTTALTRPVDVVLAPEAFSGAQWIGRTETRDCP